MIHRCFLFPFACFFFTPPQVSVISLVLLLQVKNSFVLSSSGKKDSQHFRFRKTTGKFLWYTVPFLVSFISAVLKLEMLSSSWRGVC